LTAISSASPDEVLHQLFDAAKAKDEFEFCCALIRVRGMEDVGWDPTTESFQLIQQIVGLVQAPLDRQCAFRLTLFLYAHVTEMAHFYRVPANMLRIIMGERYSLEPFHGLPKPKLPQDDPLDAEVLHLIALAKQAGMPDLATLYSDFYVRQVRNAFSHSDYALGPKSFNMRRGEPLNLDGMLTSAISGLRSSRQRTITGGDI